MKRFLKLTLAVWLCVWMVVATAWATDTSIGNVEPGAVGPYAEESGFSLSAPFESGQTYEINDADDLEAVRDYVNSGNDCKEVTFRLTADISLSGEWTPIGDDYSRNFSGTFDGNGHKITGLIVNSLSYSYQGLFGYVDATGVVKDLTVSGNVTGDGWYISGVVGFNCGVVENCISAVSITTSGTGVGGVVGYNSQGTIVNCENSGSITTSSTSVGGVVGRNSGGRVENCKNSGSVTGDSTNVGGVVGENILGTVENCKNSGSVEGKESVGGIAGTNNETVKNCENSGSVTGSGSYVGGVVGNNSSNGTTGGTVANCENSGNVTGDSIYVGGVVGGNTRGTVGDCKNSGNVTGKNYAGGVTGNNSSGQMTNCYNIGDVQGNNYIGGIAGQSSGKETNCYSVGKVSGSSDVGGVIGDKLSGTPENCYYLDSSCEKGVGEGTQTGVEAKTSAEFHSGEVAVLLGAEWGQRLTGDTYPELFALTDDPDAYRLYQVRYHYQDEGGSQQTEEAYINLDSTLKKLTSQEGLALVWYLDEECTDPFTSAALSSDEVLDLYGKWEEAPEEDDPGADDPSTPGAGGGEGSDTPGAGGSQSGGPAAPSGEETAKDSRDRDPGRDANYEAILAAIKEVKAANAGKTGKVRDYLTAAEAAVPAVPVKLYGLNASLPVDGMKTLAEGPTGLKVILDNGAAEVLIPGGFALTGDPGRVYYPLGFWKDPYGADLLKERVKGQNAGTEVCQLGGGTLPTAVTVTIKTKLTGAVNIYHWDEETRKTTLLSSATAAGGKVTFAARQLGILVITTGTL